MDCAMNDVRFTMCRLRLVRNQTNLSSNQTYRHAALISSYRDRTALMLYCLTGITITILYLEAAPIIFVWRAILQGSVERKSPKWRRPSRGLENEVPIKLKQFADIVYKF